ncbi:transporter substrate-binding domain-containing protein [Paenibacillus gallinarum]|uniref:Transporter substrate-binding domain-containing protein n=1 Tax=Paenibacillus gallinarum TaxID=2762232 RepID=A0ABR8SZ16_9BACL|nr:transporter substrate-binding domain-containing protein [Paenibacillus gallinarum]MBD7968640.1 transporter substrate-binding domain-containing protein [Paenibacillus gallinarum]
MVMNKIATKLLFLFLLSSFTILLSGCNNSDLSDETVDPAEVFDTIEVIQERGKVIAGVRFDTRLFGLKDSKSGKVEGLDIDMARTLAKKILGDETKVELKEVTSSTQIPLLKDGQIDVIIAAMSVTEDRKKEVDFSDVYFYAGQSLLVPKGSPIRGLDSLSSDTTVIAVEGSTSVKSIKDKAPESNVVEYNDYQEAFAALKSEQGDVLTADNSILLGMMREDANFEMVGGLFTNESYSIAIHKGDQKMVDTVNEMLKELKESGEYTKLYEKWIE